MKRLLVISVFIAGLFFQAACDKVTYPKERIEESIVKLCEDEYQTKIKVKLVGDTLAIYIPLPSLFDITLNLSEAAQDKIQDVLLGASRVILSTDAEIKFYCVIAQDTRLPEIQIVIIKYIEDIKRAFYQDISRGEYFKRTIIDINENPQARKEDAILEVFSKMKLDKEMQEKVLDDFFRSPPTTLEGIGYWNDRFYIKNIMLEEFLAQQMASRIKMKFREEEKLRKYALKSIKGAYQVKDGVRSFLITFRADSVLFILDVAGKKAAEQEIFKNAFGEIADVVYGYKYPDFDLVKIIEENYNKKLLISKEDIYLFKKGKIGINAILGGI